MQMVNDNCQHRDASKQLDIEADVFFSLSHNSEIVV
jgi:hypothetical protein